MRSNSLAKIVFIVFTIFLSRQGNAQIEDAGVYQFLKPWHDIYGINFIIRDRFKDTVGKSNLKFKQITYWWYEAKDSSLRNKKLTNKYITDFDRSGNPWHTLAYDSLGKTVDSAIAIYDKHGNKTEEIEYSKVNPGDPLTLNQDDYMTVNEKGEILQDSDIIRNEEVTAANPEKYKTHIFKMVFDNKGNILKTVRVYDDETVMCTSQYDSKNRETSWRLLSHGNWTTGSKKYDDSSNVMEGITVRYSGDTEKVFSRYDSKNREISSIYYVNSWVKSKHTTKYDEDGSRTETNEYYGDINKNKNTCANNNTTITTYDRYDNEISKIEYSLSRGKPLTTTTRNMITYTSAGKILIDSETVVKESKWEWEKTLGIALYKYDANANLIYYETFGEGNTSRNSKYTWAYNDKNKLLEEHDYYSCSDQYKVTEKNTYYPDGITLKEQTKRDYTGDKTVKYGTDTRILEEIQKHPDKYTQVITEYEFQ